MTLSGSAKLAGVIGWPVAHSLSPRLHGYWLKEYGIDGAYVPLAVERENLRQVLEALPRMGFRGVNLTVPHKEAALDVVDTVTDVAQRIGAVNTIFVGEDGRLTGTNTDGEGFLANLRDGAPQWQPAQGPAVVLGAGGAARAVIVSLIDAGVPEIRLVNRTRERAEAMAAEFGNVVHPLDWETRSTCLRDANVLVNTTTLGMAGQPPLDISLTALPPSAVVNDLVYAPLETELLANAKAQDLTAVDGLGMLLYQAVAGFEGWFGQRPAVTPQLRSHVLEAP